MTRFTPLLTTKMIAYKGRSNEKQFELIYMEAGNVTGGKGAKDLDAKIRVQKGLAALSH